MGKTQAFSSTMLVHYPIEGAAVGSQAIDG